MPDDAQQPAPISTTFLTVNEVAKRLSVHPRTVKRWLADGELGGFVLGDRAGWRISEEEYQEFIEKKRGKMTATASERE